MSKLIKLKEWLTLDDAANHISNVLGEPVSVTDIYRFALDGYLKLSVNFVNRATAKKAVLIKSEDVEYRKVVPSGLPNFPDGAYFNVPKNAEMRISRKYWIQEIKPELVHLTGAWDLAMVGAEKADIANRYQQETSGHTVNIPDRVGHYVQKDNVIYQLHVMQERLSKSSEGTSHDESSKVEWNTNDGEIKSKPRRLPQYRPAERLDEIENSLVVKMNEVTRFIQSFLETSPEPTSQKSSPVRDEERAALLSLIKVLFSEVKIDQKQRGIATSLIKMVELIGASLSEDTVRKIVNQIEPVVCAKAKVKITRAIATNEKKSFLVLIAALCVEAKLDYKESGAVEALVDMSEANGTPLRSDKISDLLIQIEAAVSAKSK